MKDDNGNLMANANDVLNRWNGHFRRILNVHEESKLSEGIKSHTAEPLVSEPSISEVKEAIKTLNHKSPGLDSIPSELIKRDVENVSKKN